MKITVKGQVTIPKKYREKYGLTPHTDVDFVEENGKLMVQPKQLKNKAQEMEAWIQGVTGTWPSDLTTEKVMHMTRDRWI